MAGKEVTQDFLREHFEYLPESGIFILIKQYTKYNTKCKIGDIVGCINNRGYIHIKINGKKYLAHRLACLYMTGKFPKLEIDHINGVKTDNRWRNLRDVARSTNMQNQFKPQSNSSTGLLGVSYKKDNGMYIAHIGVDGKKVYLGQFTTAERAHEIYLSAKEDLHIGNSFIN